jgi:dTDP-4-amino-4,6-dideoxygalactose transaminase
MPLHLSPMGARYGGREGQCPVTERVSDQLVRLPLHMHLTEEEQSQVIDAVRAF